MSTKRYTCPACGVLRDHERVMEYKTGRGVRLDVAMGPGGILPINGLEKHVVWRCPDCEKDLYQHIIEDGQRGGERRLGRVLFQYPFRSIAVASAVPEPVRNAAQEALVCLHARAFNACGTMARRAVHALCDEKKAQGRDLYAELLDLKNKGIITPALYDWAEELRVAGKVGAHPEWEEMTSEQAGYAVSLLEEILKYVPLSALHDRDIAPRVRSTF